MLAEPVMKILADTPAFALRDFENLLFQRRAFLFLLFAKRNVRANGDVLCWFAARIQKRENRSIHPVKGAIFGPVTDVAVPGLARRNGVPKIPKELPGMIA